MLSTARLLDRERFCSCGACCPGGGARRVELRPGWYQQLPEDVRAVHDAYLTRTLLYQQACVWAPEAAQLAAGVRAALLPADVPLTGPERPRRIDSYPRRIIRELYAAAGVGPCWPDVYPRREVVSLSPP